MSVIAPGKNYVIPLNHILQNDQKAINTIASDLKTRGYAFIKLSSDLVSQIDTCMPEINHFFNSPEPYKSKFKKAPIFGYFGVDHKESLRLLTGQRLSEHNLPNNLKPVKDLIYNLDHIMHSIGLMCSSVLFPDLIQKAKELDIPLFDMQNKWGMFDMAKYHNDGSRMDLNCKEHYDPGLLSLSLRSTAPGLQLKNEFGQWIIPPNDNSVAVLWAGAAAVKINPQIKHGIHRVKNVLGSPRIGIWYEICTADQEHRELKSEKEIKVAKVFERSSGIPMSKSMGPGLLPRTSVSTPYKYTRTDHTTPNFYFGDRYKDMGAYAMNRAI